MNKQLVALSLCGVLVPSHCKATAVPANPAGPVWSVRADGFASVATKDQLDPAKSGTTGGMGGPVVTVDNLADLEKYAAQDGPVVILIKGTIAKEPFGKNIKVTSNKTLLGLGDDATILHGELHLITVANVIIRNLTIRDSWVPNDPHGKQFDYDAVQMDGCSHIWIDHCRLTHMEDGLIDCRKGTDYLTVSWCELSNHNKAFGIGWTPELGTLHVTLHHTWIHETVQRNPSLDNGTGHLYNNYLRNISSYGNYSRGRAKVVVENSVFEKVNNPLVCGIDAEMVARGNVQRECTNTDNVQNSLKGAAFDPKQYYAYALDEASKVPDLLQKFAGPQPALGTAEFGARMAAASSR